MHNLVYLFIVLGTLLAAVGIALWRHQAWITQPRRIAKTLVVVAAPFIAWDISATWRGHWSFNPEYTLGLTVAGLPIEELLFFVAIPLVSIAVWEMMPHREAMGRLFRPVLWGVVVASAVLLLTNLGREYSTLTSIIAAGTAAIWLVSLQPIRQWFYFMGIMFGLFFIVNTVLTLLPVVEYGAAHYSGIRLGSIPLEDFFYNFTLINITILSWLYLGAIHPKKT